MTCEICGNEGVWSWTDTHGVAQCVSCGAPYRIYHYSDNHERIDKLPELLCKPEYIPVLKEYRKQTGKMIPGGHSFPGGQELATNDDVQTWNEWMDANAEKYKQGVVG